MFFEQEVDDSRVVAAVQVVFDVKVGVFHAGFEIAEEGERVYVLEEHLYVGKFVCEIVADTKVGGCEGVKVFEHACGGAGGGDKFENFDVLAEATVELFVVCYLLVVEHANAAVGRSGGGFEASFGETFFEVVYLFLYFFNSKT